MSPHAKSAFLEKNLIAYLGNKRRLLPLIEKAIGECVSWGSRHLDAKGVFVDLFAGTGVVSRLAKSMGFQVVANDWERYAELLAKAFVGLGPDDLRLFDVEGGLDRVLSELNAEAAASPNDPYIARFYCPANDERPDVENERMFWTRRNGERIDVLRDAIERRYPDAVATRKQRQLLLALLLVEASTRSNTSGVFKGFHAGFGGRKGDALSRILKPVELKAPALCEGPRARVFRADARRLARKMRRIESEIVYLDPPYNQHQYGSNYHLLNTIALGDRPEVRSDFHQGEKIVDKAAIRKDWTATKSAFCSRVTATREFAGLVADVRAKYILVSYSTEGVIKVDDLIRIMAEKGRIGVVTTDYTRFRGGRQTVTTKTRNVEFVLIADTGRPSTEAEIRHVRSLLVSDEARSLGGEIFLPAGDERALDFGGLKIPLTPRLQIEPSFFDRLAGESLERQNAVLTELRLRLPEGHHHAVEGIIDLLTRRTDLDDRFLLERAKALTEKVIAKKYPVERKRAEDALSRLALTAA